MAELTSLEDFEKSLVHSRKDNTDEALDKALDTKPGKDSGRRKHHHHHHHHRHRSSRHRHDGDGPEDQHRHKRSRRSREGEGDIPEQRDRSSRVTAQPSYTDSIHGDDREWVGKDAAPGSLLDEAEDSRLEGTGKELKRDSWMEAPSALDVDYTQRGIKKILEPTVSRSSKADFALKIHDNELNKHHLQDLADGKAVPDDVVDQPAQHDVDYVFGDSGAQWRMTKLKAVYRQAEETGRSVDDVAAERYGDLRAFDDAREEEFELERRQTYGKGYVGKEKPNGELFQERKIDAGIHKASVSSAGSPAYRPPPQGEIMEETPATAQTVPLDQTALNRLKAQMMKAKLRGSASVAALESEYNNAMASFANRKESNIVVLGTMETRMLAGGRKGEVKVIDNKRGRERGLVEENEDMTIDDMVREERRTRGQAGGEGKRFAERIAKDGKFDNDLDYMDENANKLAKRVQQSEVNLKNTAISDFQKMNRILDSCPLCHHEDTDTPPIAPLVSLATRVYLSLPTEPEISEGGACIVPIQHRCNLLECDDDEWEEIRNFMKCLTRMYHGQGRDVIFYENAATPQRKKHATLEVVPLPSGLGETAPAFFKEAILTSDEEWTQHKKLIDTLSKAKQGLGKLAFRKTLVKEMPYFHVWFTLDGGLGHIVEDADRWPKGDLFAREVIGGMLDVEPDVIKRQGRWNKVGDRRVDGFRKRWKKFDWTTVLAAA
ncbi:MAG: cell cycle control cwf19 [Lasallia pustulata]|uniref:Cell cycle control cwf19 n=1 Tax=Lasallia pustulata TaxID=136370 RepID=A0A5M8PED8_9LECA|nr:MAG: cell cycle control cwf19 [Lasallia pustulata]